MNETVFAQALKDHSENDARQFEALTEALAGIAKDIGRLSESVRQLEKNMDKRFEQIDKKMEPLLEVYSGLLLGNKIVIWLAGIVGAFATIGGVIIGIWSFVTHR